MQQMYQNIRVHSINIENVRKEIIKRITKKIRIKLLWQAVKVCVNLP